MVKTNSSGTTISSFQIGKSGSTVYTGAVDPTTLPAFGVYGDLYLSTLAGGQTWKKSGGTWVEIITIVTDDDSGLGPAKGVAFQLKGGPGIKVSNIFGYMIVEATDTIWTMQGGVDGITASTLKYVSMGTSAAQAQVPMPYPGEVLAISIGVTLPCTSGYCGAHIQKNGTTVTTTGQFARIDTTNNWWHYKILDTPHPFVAGDRIGLVTRPVSFNPTGSDASVMAWIKKTS